MTLGASRDSPPLKDRKVWGSSVDEAARWPSVAESRLFALQGMKRRVGIIRLWPDQAAAEHESVERFRKAFELLGVTLVEVDRLGFMLGGPNRQVTRHDVDFVISLHYETPKAYDCFSWGALWNPIDFYVDWGVKPYLDNQFTHDGFFVVGSPVVDRLAKFELTGRTKPAAFAQVNHTLSGPFYAPAHRTDRRLAYCGINWERLGGTPGRYDALLTPLDKADILDIYGPSVVRGMEVWSGFESYRHPVPFDGISLVKELSKSGAVLALSSAAHVRSEIMSNRLFEGAAAGALVFTDDNPFVERYFAEEVVLLDLVGDPSRDAPAVLDAMRHFNAHPDEAFTKCAALQVKLEDVYGLHQQLLNAYDAFAAWTKQDRLEIETERLGSLRLILLHTEKLIFPEELISDLATQDYAEVKITLVLPRPESGQPAPLSFVPPTNVEVVYVPLRSVQTDNPIGLIIANLLDDVTEDYVAVFRGHERVFHDYARRMLQTIRTDAAFEAAVCAKLVRHYDPQAKAMRGVEYVDFHPAKLGVPFDPITLGNVVIRTSTLRTWAGAFQMLGWADTVKLVSRKLTVDIGVYDQPLISADLKRYEMIADDKSPYAARKAAEVVERVHPQQYVEAPSAVAEAPDEVPLMTMAVIMDMTALEKRAVILDLIRNLPMPRFLLKSGGVIVRLMLPKRSKSQAIVRSEK